MIVNKIKPVFDILAILLLLFLLHLILAPQLSSGWQHNYLTKTWLAGCPNEQSMYSLMPVVPTTSPPTPKKYFKDVVLKSFVNARLYFKSWRNGNLR